MKGLGCDNSVVKADFYCKGCGGSGHERLGSEGPCCGIAVCKVEAQLGGGGGRGCKRLGRR